MAWRLAKSLDRLRAQVNAAAPKRDKSSDGTIGDSAHASRTSDHNPYIRLNGVGIVRALDITHDPEDGLDSYALAKHLASKRDRRVRYIISSLGQKKPNGRPQGLIWNPAVSSEWRLYGGSNPHNLHVHVSVSESSGLFDDTSDWDIGLDKASLVTRTIEAAKAIILSPKKKVPTLSVGSRGADVVRLQNLLGIKADGKFGPITRSAVVSFQKNHGLTPDGKVGPYTWQELESTEQKK